MIIYITQKSYFMVIKHFIEFFTNKNMQVIYVNETKINYKKKIFEIYKNFGFINFINLIVLELFYFFLLRSEAKKIIYENVKDIDLNLHLEKKLQYLNIKKIISIGCPCKIDINLSIKYGTELINLHGGIIPYQKGKFSPIQSLKNKHKFIGASLHYMSDQFDSGDLISQNYFKVVSNNKLKNYIRVISISSVLLRDYLNNKVNIIPNDIKKQIYINNN